MLSPASPFANCKSIQSIHVSREKEIKKRHSDIFVLPTTKGSVVGEQFARNAKIREIETDWTIIQDAFDSGIHDANDDSNVTPVLNESDILRNESQRRCSNRTIASKKNPFEASTPIRSPQLQHSHIDVPRNALFQQLDLDFAENDLFTPPTGYEDSLLAPPQGFENTSQAPINTSKQPSFAHFESQNAPEIDGFVSQPIVCPDLIAVLGEDSFEYQTMMKLKKLWQKNTHPIKVDSLLASRCNRFEAAKTFAALLGKRNFQCVR